MNTTTNTAPANDVLPLFGSKRVSGRPVTETAKLVRKDIAAAVKSGLLPAGLKVSVRSGGSSMHSTLKLYVTACPGVVFMSTAFVRHMLTTPNVFPGHLNRHSPRGAQILKTLRALAAAYNRDDSDIQSDFFSCDFFLDATFTWEIETAQTREIETAFRSMAS